MLKMNVNIVIIQKHKCRFFSLKRKWSHIALWWASSSRVATCVLPKYPETRDSDIWFNFKVEMESQIKAGASVPQHVRSSCCWMSTGSATTKHWNSGGGGGLNADIFYVHQHH